MKSLKRAEKSNIPGPNALCSPSDVPRRKRSVSRAVSMKAVNSEISEVRTELQILVPSTSRAHPCQLPRQKRKCKKIPADSTNSEQTWISEACRRPRQRRKCKKIPADSTNSEQTIPLVSCIRGQARRRGTNNGTQQGKLDSSLLNKYLGDLWQRIPNDKKESAAYIDCLWFTMYHKQSHRERVLSWIRREKIFSKKYVFLPICRWSHWSLLIFCHLGEKLQSKNTTPCMLLLDSLHDADPKRLEPDIRKFLLDIYEAEERRETKRLIYNIPLLVPKVPQQNDDKECGYFVLYYINQFLMNSPKTFSISDGYPYFMKKDWFTTEVFKSFCTTLRSYDDDQQTDIVDDLCNATTDDVIMVE